MKLKAFFRAKQQELAHQKKLLKRKTFILKVKIFFLGVLPVVIALLAVKTLQILLQIKLREAASAALTPDSPENSLSKPVIKPVSQTSFKPEFITPVPVPGTSACPQPDKSVSAVPAMSDD